MTAPTYDRPDQCPDAAKHVADRRMGDYRKVRTRKCPACGLWALPAEPAAPPSPNAGYEWFEAAVRARRERNA